MKKRRLVRWFLLIIVMALLSVSGALLPKVDTALAYSRGVRAAERDEWRQAFMLFSRVCQRNCQYREAASRLIEAASKAIQHQQKEMDAGEEISIIRWLISAGELESAAAAFDNSTVAVPSGHFTMGDTHGDDDERPQRRIYLDAYEIDRYEVTNIQYQRFLLETGRRAPVHWSGTDYPPGQADFPVVGVGWEDASAYCAWAGKRLPSEAEWEKACRGPNGNVYPWGDDWDGTLANTGIAQADQWPEQYEDGWKLVLTPGTGDHNLGLRPVGSYLDGASGYGALDMAGNVSEWVLDWYSPEFYSEMPGENPVSLGPPWQHAVRGSAWHDRVGQADTVAAESRCSARNASHSYDTPRLGFRCARSLP